MKGLILYFILLLTSCKELDDWARALEQAEIERGKAMMHKSEEAAKKWAEHVGMTPQQTTCDSLKSDAYYKFVCTVLDERHLVIITCVDANDGSHTFACSPKY